MWADFCKWLSDPINLTAISTVLIAAFTVVLAVVGTCQARLTRQAIEDVRKSSERDLRAYVFAVAGEVWNVNVPRVGSVHRVSVKLENSGKTPAYKVTTKFGFRFGQNQFEKPFSGIEIFDQEHILAGNGGHTTAEITLAASEVPDVEGVGKGIFVVGRVDYFDTFDRPQWTDVRWEMRKDATNGETTLHPCRNGNGCS